MFLVSKQLSQCKQEEEALTRLLAVDISAFRMSGSYLLEEDDLEFTVRKVRYEEKREVLKNRPIYLISSVFSQLFLCFVYQRELTEEASEQQREASTEVTLGKHSC